MLIKLDMGVYINTEFVTSLDGTKGSYGVRLVGGDGYDYITSADRQRIIKAIGLEGKDTKKQGPTNNIDPRAVHYFVDGDKVVKMTITSGKYVGVYDVVAEMWGAKEDEDETN